MDPSVGGYETIVIAGNFPQGIGMRFQATIEIMRELYLDLPRRMRRGILQAAGITLA